MKLNFGNAAARDGEERIPAGEMSDYFVLWYSESFFQLQFQILSFTRKLRKNQINFIDQPGSRSRRSILF